MNSSNLESVLERVGDLPAMPEVVAEVLHLADDPESDMEKVSRVIERDPALAARILRVSNSPYFGMRQHVGTLKLAMVILGVREIKNIVLGVSLFDTLRDVNTERLLKERFWEVSFRVGSVSKKLGQGLGLGCQGEDFIAGLLHGIGKMLLCKYCGVKYAHLIQESNSDDDLVVMERAALGFSHADAAAALGKRWNLPEPLCDAIWLHMPHPEVQLTEARDPRLAAAVRIAYYAGREPTPETDAGVRFALEQQEAWAALGATTGVWAPEERAVALQALVLGVLAEGGDSPPPSLSA